MEELLRVRVEFDDRKMISKSQRSDGLNRCWILLNPRIATISDLASHIAETFHLKRSCPHGILLSMDDFSLPPFESTCILKDNDIIRVRKKDAKRMDMIDIGDDTHYIQDSEVMEKQHVVSSERLLAVREFEEDSGHKSKDNGYLCAYIENGSPSMRKKKRKLSDGIQGSKTKKLKTSSKKIVVTDKDEVTDKDDEDSHLGHGLGSSLKRGSSNKKDDLSKGDGRPGSVIAAQLEDNAVRMTSLQLEKRKKKIKATSKKLHVTTDQDVLTDKEDEDIHLRQSLGSSHKRGSSNQKDNLTNKKGRSNSVIAFQLEDNTGKVISPVQIEKRKKKFKTSSKKLNVTTDQDEVTEKECKDIHVRQSLGSSYKRGSSNKTKGLSNVDGKSDSAIASQLEDKAWKVTSPVQIEKRRKKIKLMSPDEGITTTQGVENIPREQDENNWQKRDDSSKKLHSNDEQSDKTRISDADADADARITSQLNDCISKKPIPVMLRNIQSEEVVLENTHKQGRNARRKKARRKWLKEIRSPKSQNFQKELPQNVIHTELPEQPVADLNIETEKEIVPVVVRPGHIRFQLLDEEQIQEHPQETVDTLKWNGITSKKKGQKWGREKTTSKWNDSNGYKEYSTEKAISGETGNTSLLNDLQSNGKGKAISEKGKAGSNGIDFESLFPLTRIPQVGDVLVYRLIELSSSWCPEVSPFRVGQVTSYNYISMSIILVPLPEYPIFSLADKEGDDGIPQLDASPYNEDGTLQIHYPSLLDVRLLKASDSEATTSDYPGQVLSTEEVAPVNNCEMAVTTSNAKETVVQPTENGSADVVENGNAGGVSSWDQIKQALNEKKAELQKNNGLDESNCKQSTASTSWSYRALRRSAMGPTLAYLRDQDGKQADNRN